MSELLDLAVFAAVAKTARKSATLLEDMDIVEARAAVTVKDRNKVTNPEEQSLVLVFARRNLNLSLIYKGCTHLVVPKYSVGAVTSQLQEMVDDGQFDAEIIAVQAVVKETKAKKAASVTVEAVPLEEGTLKTPILDSIKSHINTPPNIDGLDLSSID